MTRVSTVVVTHNSGAVIGQCLNAVVERSAEIVVVDNASDDSTVKQLQLYRQVRIVANPSNLGFAAAANQGIRAASHRAVLLLNPDTTLDSPLDSMLDACLSKGVGAVGGLLTGENGAPQHGFNVRRFPTPVCLSLEALGVNALWENNPANRRYRYGGFDYLRATDVEQPAGAFLMIRREAFDAVGGFDERFFPVWFEDVDFCKRLHEAGWTIRYTPAARARHQGAHSVGKLPVPQKTLYWYGSLLRYTELHFSFRGKLLVYGSVIAGSVLRGLTGMVRSGKMEPVASYSQVLGRAARSLAATLAAARGGGGGASSPRFPDAVVTPVAVPADKVITNTDGPRSLHVQ